MNDGTLSTGESLDILEARHACMPSGIGLLAESIEISSFDSFHNYLINIINPEIPLVDKYGPSMKEAVDRYNRHGEVFNTLVHQQHPGIRQNGQQETIELIFWCRMHLSESSW